MNLYATTGTTATVIIQSANNTGNTYAENLSGGTFGGLFANPNSYGVEISNATQTTQSLYSWTFTKGSTQSPVAGTLVSGLSIETNGGTTTINPATAAPIPPSILLMGSGLLGLVGIGRRKFFA
jgi:hypothetical protein